MVLVREKWCHARCPGLGIWVQLASVTRCCVTWANRSPSLDLLHKVWGLDGENVLVLQFHQSVQCWDLASSVLASCVPQGWLQGHPWLLSSLLCPVLSAEGVFSFPSGPACPQDATFSAFHHVGSSGRQFSERHACLSQPELKGILSSRL